MHAMSLPRGSTGSKFETAVKVISKYIWTLHWVKNYLFKEMISRHFFKTLPPKKKLIPISNQRSFELEYLVDQILVSLDSI
jgi:hypothetical protein